MADSQARWLVTGGTGFLGSHIARRLIADGIHPVLFDIAALPPDDDDIKDQVTVIDGDVQDREAIRARVQQLVDSRQRRDAARANDRRNDMRRALGAFN